MNIGIQSRGFRLTPAMESFIRARLAPLGRFGGIVDRILVRLRDDNGPRGGLDKRCDLDVQLRGRRPVRLRERRGDLYEAVGLVAARAKHHVARSSQRHADFLRRRS